jgi:hypothetical protein
MRRSVVLIAIMFAGLCGVSALEVLRATAVASNTSVILTADAISAEQALAAARERGFTPTSAATRRGSIYVADALDRKGQKLRLVIDARTGDVIGAGRQPDAPVQQRVGENESRNLSLR